MRARAGLLTMLVVVLAGTALGASAAGAAGRCHGHAWCDTRFSPDHRAALLIAAMTPAERIGLLTADRRGLFPTGPHSSTQSGLRRLGLPAVQYTDGPAGPTHGRSTGLPAPLALAATWDPDAARRYGAVVGREARAKGNDVVHGPMVNIMRSPLGGRTFEAFGEDPFLAGRTAAAWVRGAQAEGVIATVKHLAENNQESDRMRVDVRVSERALREIELPAFEAAVRAGVGSVMCAYNRVNGLPACQSPHLLTGVLGGWGFRGFVLADYGAVHDAAAAVRAGLDFDPASGPIAAPDPLAGAVADGRLPMADVDRADRRMLRTFFAAGIFDRPARARIPRSADAQDAHRIEGQAITLLENRDRMLPLRASRLKSIAVIGVGGTGYPAGQGSSRVQPYRNVTPLAAIRKRAGPRVRVVGYSGKDVRRAARLAGHVDVAIVAVTDLLTESLDRRCLTLECPPVFGDQDRLIRAVAAVNPRTAVVLETGAPVLTPWRDRVAGLLEAWYPGQEGGTAIAQVLFGDRDPAGRLPVTFPARAGQWPTAGDRRVYPGVGYEEHYREGLQVGYRFYDARSRRPAFPFGFGRSYTTFALGRLRVAGTGGGRYEAAVPVLNTGRRSGTTVIQLYVTHPAADGEPPRQLEAFTRVALRPGATATARLRLDRRSFAIYDTARGHWRVRGGRYRVLVGTSSRDLPLSAVLSLRPGA